MGKIKDLNTRVLTTSEEQLSMEQIKREYFELLGETATLTKEIGDAIANDFARHVDADWARDICKMLMSNSIKIESHAFNALVAKML